MRMPSQKLYSLQKVAGVGMIEILVSLFVLTEIDTKENVGVTDGFAAICVSDPGNCLLLANIQG